MKIIYNDYIPFKGYIAMNLFGILFVRGNKTLSKDTINHESIHSEQYKDLLYVIYLNWIENNMNEMYKKKYISIDWN